MASIEGAPWLASAGAQAVFRALNRDGAEARAVGGAVRNALIGRPVRDVDFATTATPEEIQRLAHAAGLRTIPTGLEHGTVTILARGAAYEATTLREDMATDGRRAQVRFGRDWRRDAERRDFTMNALYAGATGEVYDPLGGHADALAGRVRFIGDPAMRIKEDYLRILRFFRFHAEYGSGPIDRDGFDAAIAGRAGLAALSAERVRAELFRLLAAPGAAATLAELTAAGLLVMALGGVAQPGVLERLAAMEAALEIQPDAALRLAALAVMCEEDAYRLGGRLRLSNAERDRLRNAAAGRLLRRIPDEATSRRLLRRLGADAYRERVLIAWAHSGDSADDAHWRRLVSLPERWLPPPFPIAGKDLMAIGARPGPQMGATLDALERLWLASDFAMTRETLLEEARRMLERAGSGG